MPDILPAQYLRKPHRFMLFIDGEYLAIEYGKLLAGEAPREDVSYEPAIYVWPSIIDKLIERVDFTRKYYYTTAQGDDARILELEDKLQNLGFEAPRVYKKTRGRKSKRVDVSLVTDFLKQAHRDNFDIAILLSGDEDFVPAVEAVTDEGKRVVLWYLSSGLSHALKRSVDHSIDMTNFFLDPKPMEYFHSKT